MAEAPDITGNKFGRLLVIERVENDRGRRAQWRCVCECGRETVTTGSRLRAGHTQSCGCKRAESNPRGPKAKARMYGARNPKYKHGLSRTRLYCIWVNMRQRCNNPNAHEYAAYGGRGIKVCEEWDAEFMAFYSWAVEHGYRPDLTLDRIDVNGNYTGHNCRWATKEQQYANMRRRK